jgi:uncharacterized protein (TIGR03086 family)
LFKTPATAADTVGGMLMPPHSLVAEAAAPAVAVVRAIRPDQLDAPTPCREYDVRKLLNHLLYWGPSLAGAARKEAVPPPAASEQDADLTGDDWAAAVAGQIDRVAAAWGDPGAWEGTTRVVGPDPVPASLVGGMVLTELVVHGWDLARATSQRPRWQPALLDYVHREVEKTADWGRELGSYGPAVPVPGTAPVLDRTLGLIGRDPAWVIPAA